MQTFAGPPTAKQIRTFLAVARHGSMSAASDDLDISQPAVSKHIYALEAKVGTLFVRRRGARLALTDAGRSFYERSEEILQKLLDIGSDMGGFQNAIAPIRVGSGEYLFVKIQDGIAKFIAEYPNILVELRLFESQDEGFKALGNGLIDIFAVTKIARPAALNDDLIRCTPMSVYAREDLIAWGANNGTGLPIVLPKEASPAETMVREIIETLNVPITRQIYRAQYLRTSFEICRNGSAAALLYDEDVAELKSSESTPIRRIADRSFDCFRCSFLGNSAMHRPSAHELAKIILTA